MAFSDLSLVQALRARGIAVPDVILSAHAKEHDLFGYRSVKFGIVAGLSLFLVTLVIVIGNKHQHLQMNLPLWVYCVLAVASLLTLLAIERHDRRRDAGRPRVFHRVLAAVFLVVGVSMAAQPMATLLNGVGVEPDLVQVFTVHAGSLEPIDSHTGIGTIYVLKPQSRQTWLKEGSSITLNVKKGLLGLWEYDDAALRALPDN